MPPNGNGSSPHNGRAEEPSADNRITRLEVRMENVATKADLAKVNGDMKTEIAKVNGRIDTLRHEIKTDIARLETRIESFRADMTEKMNTMLRWIVGSMGTMIIAVLSLLAAFLFRLP